MAKKSGLGQQIFVNGYDLSGDIAAIEGPFCMQDEPWIRPGPKRER